MNQLPKGNKWSAIPVALSEGKQGSGPKGDEVLQNTGLSFVLPKEVDEILARAV